MYCDIWYLKRNEIQVIFANANVSHKIKPLIFGSNSQFTLKKKKTLLRSQSDVGGISGKKCKQYVYTLKCV